MSRTPSYESPPGFAVRPLHIWDSCSCEPCVWQRLSQRMRVPSSNTSDIFGVEMAETVHSGSLPPRRMGSALNAQKKHRQASTPLVTAMPPYHHESIAYPEVYVYPSSSHITFPVVDYSNGAGQRGVQYSLDHTDLAPFSSSRPTCFLAISPQCARPADFEAALCPKDSGLIIRARVLQTRKPVPLTEFEDAEELRRDLIQLEIWDEDAENDSTKSGHGGNAGAGGEGANRNNGVKGGILKKKNK